MAGGWRFCLGQAEVRTSPVLRLFSLGIPIPIPGSLLPATRLGPGGLLNQPRRGPRPCRRGRPQRSSQVHSQAFALSHPGLASPPPTHTHTPHTRTAPCPPRGRLLGARTKAPGVWRGQQRLYLGPTRHSGCPAAPGCGRGGGGHLSSARDEPGVLAKTREVGGGGNLAQKPRNSDSEVSSVGSGLSEDSDFEFGCTGKHGNRMQIGVCRLEALHRGQFCF